jgi:hypothetical protein
MIRPLIALLTTQTYIVALVFTDSGHLRTTLVVTPIYSQQAHPPLAFCSIELSVPLLLDPRCIAPIQRTQSRPTWLTICCA